MTYISCGIPKLVREDFRPGCVKAVLKLLRGIYKYILVYIRIYVCKNVYRSGI